MIELTGGYYVKVTAHSYNVVYDTGRITKTKNGILEKVYEPVTYHGTMADAIRGAMKDMQKRKLSDLDGTLADAISEIKEVHERFERLLREVVKGAGE
jgi:hypothetical protein